MYLDSTYFNSPKILDLRDYLNVVDNINLNDVITTLGLMPMTSPREIKLTNLTQFWKDVNSTQEIFFRLSLEGLCMDIPMNKMFIEETGEIVQINGNCIFSMNGPFIMVNLAIMNNTLFIYAQVSSSK